jgi:hypothetical protein
VTFLTLLRTPDMLDCEWRFCAELIFWIGVDSSEVTLWWTLVVEARLRFGFRGLTWAG